MFQHLGVWGLRPQRVQGSALAFLLLASAAHATCTTHRVADLPLTVWDQKILVTVALNGSPETMALDTGAGITAISTEAAGRLNIPHDFDHHVELGGVGGANSALFMAQLDTLDLGGLRFAHQALPIIDFPLRDGAGRPIAGLLGADILSRFDVDLDIRRRPHGAVADSRPATHRPRPWDANSRSAAGRSGRRPSHPGPPARRRHQADRRAGTRAQAGWT